MRAAVYGAGALGTVLGAALTRSGADVELVSRDQEHVDALNRSGARITGLREWTVQVKACTPQQMSGRYDVILLLTKQMANTAALPRLAEHLAPDGIVCALQNGIPEPELAAALGADRVAGGVVTWNAVRIGAGQARLSPPESSLHFKIGSLPGTDPRRLDPVKALLERFCPAEPVEDLLGLRWSKLLINAALSCPASILGGKCGAVLEDARWRRIALYLLRECIAVGHAAGVKFEPVQGYDYPAELAFSTLREEQQVLAKMPELFARNAPAVPSMLLDLQKKRPCEIGALNGFVCRTGLERGVPTPFNDTAVRLVREIAAGEKTFSPEHAAEFAVLLPE